MSARAMRAPADAVRVESGDICFGPFRLSPTRHALFEGGRPVRLGSRALDILSALVARPGDVVAKDELIAAAWPDTFVDEINLRVHVVALRKALGDGRQACRYIGTIAGRGYRFIAPVTVAPGPSSARYGRAQPQRPEGVPAPVTPIHGRSDAIGAICEELPRCRLVTLIGPPGVGKTTVAAAVAREAAASFGDNVRFLDFAPMADAGGPVAAAASAVEATRAFTTAMAAEASALAGERTLVVLDNCEHVVEAVAPLAENLLRGMPGISILATSREPLRADGERVHRLTPLAIPPASALLSAREAMGFASVQLFVERVIDCEDGFQLSDLAAPAVGEICRRVDGLPLALELAAGRVQALGVANLRAMRDDQFLLLGGGRRTASPRHRTLSAALDWSYDRLPEEQRAVLCRFGCFPAGFDLEAAIETAGAAGMDVADAMSAIASLVARSLILAETEGSKVMYRLLGTTRAYVLDKLTRSGGTVQVPQWKRDGSRRSIDPSLDAGRGFRNELFGVPVLGRELRAN